MKTCAYRLTLATVLSACFFLRAFAGEQLPAPEILPEGTILYAELSPWKQWSEDFSKTAVAQIAADPDVRAFLAGPFSQLSKMIQAGKEAAAPVPADPNVPNPNMLSSFFAMLDKLAPGPFTVAVRYSAEDEIAKRPPAWAFVAGVNDEKNMEDKNKNILTLLDSIVRDSKIDMVGVTDYQSGKLLTIKIAGDKSVTLVLHKNRLIASNDLEFGKQIMDGMAGTLTRKLSQTAAFKSTGLTGNEHLGAYMDIAGMQKALGAVEKGSEGRLGEFFALAGLNKAGTVAWSLKMNGPAFESRTAIFSKNERAGLLGALDEEPLSADSLKMIPASTPFAAGFRLKKERLLPLIRSAFKTAQGDKGAENFDTVLKEWGADGRSLDTDLREAFGGEFILTSLSGNDAAGSSTMVPAFAASLSVANPQKAEATLSRLLNKMADRMDPTGGALKEIEGTKIRYLAPSADAGALMVTPAFALAENRLLIAFDVPSLKKALRMARDGGGLASSERFKTALDGVGGKMGPMFSYVDYGYVFKTTFGVTTTALRLVVPTELLKAAGVDLNLLPETEAVTQHLFPAMSVAQITPSGVVMTSRSPLPSMEVLTPPIAAITAIYASFGWKKE